MELENVEKILKKVIDERGLIIADCNTYNGARHNVPKSRIVSSRWLARRIHQYVLINR